MHRNSPGFTQCLFRSCCRLFAKPAALAAVLLLGLAAVQQYAPLRVEAAGDEPPIRGPFVDPVEAYPHAPAVFPGPLTYRPHLSTQPESLQSPLAPLRLTPGETRKSNAPQLSGWEDAVAQSEPGAGNMPAPISAGFPGLNMNLDGAGWPPDTVGDVSATHYIQAVNISIGIFDLNGNVLYRATFNQFFTGPADTPCDENNRGDPVVLYDAYVDRWLVTDFAWSGSPQQPGYYQCLAVSRGPDPINDGWYFYALRADTGGFELYLNDYPKLGVWHDGWYMTANMFQMVSPGIGFGVRVWALDRQVMIQGSPLREVHYDLCTHGDCASLLPAHDNLAQAPPASLPPSYLLASAPPDQLQLWKFRPDFDSPQSSTFTGPYTLPVAPFATASSIPQKDTPQVLDSLSPRLMMQLQYRFKDGNESLWANHTVASGGVAGVRWYEIKNPASAAPLLAQQSTYQPDDTHRWMASLAVDRDGNMAVGYSTSSDSLFPSIRIAGRMAPEIPNLLPQSEVEVVTGTGAQAFPNRWGDYSAMTVAPDGCTFYYTNEYYIQTGFYWQTWIIPLRYPSCGQPKGTLQGVVRDAFTLLPLADTPVTVTSADLTLTVKTDPGGVFSLPLVQDTYTVTAGPQPPGYPEATELVGVQVENGTTTSIDLLLAPYPALALDAVILDDSQADGNGNQVPEPGEARIAMQVNLVNTGSIKATNIHSQLDILTPGVYPVISRSIYPNILPGQVQSQKFPYLFSLDPGLPCGTEIQFQHVVTEKPQTFTFDLSFEAALREPRQELVSDNVEHGALFWQTSGVNNTWGILDVLDAPSPRHAWSDSPVGNYRNNANASLVSASYNLAGKRNVQVAFKVKYALEPGWDYLYLETSVDGGQTWSPEPLVSFSGYQTAWTSIVLPAPGLDNQADARLRFRLLSDEYITYDGAFLDDIAISFEPYNCSFPVALPPSAPVPLAPMAWELFKEIIFNEVTFHWLAGPSGAPVDGYHLYLDGLLVASTSGTQTSAKISVPPGEHAWTVEAFNLFGTSPSAAQTFFINPFQVIFPIFFNY